MKINNISLFIIFILIIKSKNDSNSYNISTILSTHPMQYSENEFNSSTNIRLFSSNNISTSYNNSNNKNIFLTNTSISPINSTFINVNNIIFRQNPKFANPNIETTINTPNSLLVTNAFIGSTMNIAYNNYSLIFLQAQVIDYFLKIYLFYEKQYPNSLKIKINIDTPFRNLQIIREKQFLNANYTRSNNNIVEYLSILIDYKNTLNSRVTIEKIEVMENENDNRNTYDIYFGVDDNNLKTIKAENLINTGAFNFSNVLDKANYNHYIYDIYNISEGCNFSINIYKNETIYIGNKTIILNFTEFFNGSTINAICTLSSEYTGKIPCTLNNQTNSIYFIKPFVYPFDDEIFIFKQEKDQVFNLLCNKTNSKKNAISKTVIIIIIFSVIIIICFIILLIITFHKHRDHLSPVSNISNKNTNNQNSVNKESGVNSSLELN